MAEPYIEETQRVLGALIKKPKLIDKVLSKPPFRFIHDVVKNVISETGYLDGVYSEEELDAENIQDKEGKLSFLTKLITSVEQSTGSKLPTKASKIAAGLEPENTNLLLQKLAEAASKKPSSSSKKSSSSSSKKASSSSSSSSDKKESSSSSTKKSSSRSSNSPEKGRKGSDSPEKTRSSEKSSSSSSSSSRKNSDSPEKARRKEDSPERRRRDDDGKELKKTSSKERERERDKEKAGDPKEEQKRKEREEREKEKERERERERAEREKEKEKERADREKERERERAEKEKEREKEKQEREKERQEKEKEKEREREKAKKEEEAANAAEETKEEEGRQRSARPVTARRAPPKQLSNVRVVEKSKSDKVETTVASPQVIAEGTAKDDEDLIVKVEARIDDEAPLIQDENEQHGMLVKNMQSTNKELQRGARDTKTATTKIRDTKEMAKEKLQKELEQVRESIQSLTRGANPLGKCVDFVPEDIESMDKELESWKNENIKQTQLVEEEERSTEQSLQPFYTKMNDLDIQIKDQLSKINATKAKLIENDRAIHQIFD